MPTDDFAQLSRKLNGFAREWDGRALQGRLTRLGVEAKKDAAKAATDEFGDRSMSGWRRGSPIELAARFDVKGSEVHVEPTPRSRGPWRVAEEGRNPGGVPRPSRKRRRARRWNGTTAGKNTWTEAAAIIARETPARARREVQRALAQHFRRG